MRRSTPPTAPRAALQALNAANADAELDDLLHQYFRLAAPAAKRRLKRPLAHESRSEPPAVVTPENALQRLKRFLKSSRDSDRHIQRVIDALTRQLRKATRQRALLPLAVRLASELFARSAVFRARVAAQAAALFTLLLKAAGERDVASRPRGQPQSADVDAVLAMVERWTEQFGAKYPTIVAGHAGLLEMGYTFPRARETTAQAERDAAEQRRHQVSVRELQVRKMEREMATHVPEMETTVVEMDSVFEILVPTLEAFEVDESKDLGDTNDMDEQHAQHEEPATMRLKTNDDDNDDGDDSVEWEDVSCADGDALHVRETVDDGHAASTGHGRDANDNDEDSNVEWEDVDDNAAGSERDDDVDDHEFSAADDMDINEIVQAYGLGSSSYQLTISIPTTLCEKSAENEVLFRSLTDGVLQIRKRFLPLVNDWLQIADGDAVALAQPRDAALLRQLHDLRRRLEAVTLKWEDLVKESERKQFARIRPHVVTLPLAAFDARPAHDTRAIATKRSKLA